MTSCYRKSNSTVIGDTSNIDGACSLITTSELFSPCCPIKPNNPLGGSGNLCLSDYLCWDSNPNAGASGFLTASCTDKTYASGECTEHCTDSPVPSVIYDPDTGLWACCSWSYEGGTDCANPTDETWPAPAPQVLLNAASSSSSIIGTATSSTASSTSTSALTTNTSSSTIANTNTSPPTSSATSSAPVLASSGLTTGAKAGIGIGAAIGALLLIGMLYFLFNMQRRLKLAEARQSQIMQTDRENLPDKRYEYGPAEVQDPDVDLGRTQMQRAEWSKPELAALSRKPVHELGGR